LVVIDDDHREASGRDSGRKSDDDTEAIDASGAHDVSDYEEGDLEEDDASELDAGSADASDEAEIEAFDEDDGDADDEAIDIDAVVELTSKEQSARALEIRRALEERRERKQLSEDLDYLDLDDE